MRVLGLDVGEKRIGIAVADPLGITAQGLTTIQSRGWGEDIRRIAQIAAEYGTNRIVIGMPYSMNGGIGPQAQSIRSFGDRLAGETGLEIRYKDERLSTAGAQRALIEGGVRREKRKTVVDKIAAALILQSFLDAGGWREAELYATSARKSVMRVKRDRMDNSAEQATIVELYDEDGESVRFEHLMTLVHEGESYVLLTAVDPIEDADEDEVIILRITTDDAGEDAYVTLDDEALCEAIFARYLEIAEADEDDSGSEGDEEE